MLTRDSQIILTCFNDCYQAQQILNVQVKEAPRFPFHKLTCIKHLPEINISEPVLPVMYGCDRKMAKRFEQIRKSENSLYTNLLRRIITRFKGIGQFTI